MEIDMEIDMKIDMEIYRLLLFLTVNSITQ